MKKTTYRAAAKIEVRPSPEKGRGAFAVKPIRRGEIIEVSPGLFLRKDESDLVGMTDLGNYLFNTSGGALVGLGFASMYNHDKDPNCDYKATRSTVAIVALKAIKPGDELTIDYGWDAETVEAANVVIAKRAKKK